MKKLFYILIFFCFVFSVNAQQNLIPNHSFEITDTCPAPGGSPSHWAKDWFDVRNTPDFFSTCDTSGGIFSVPTNAFGFQCASNGNNYLGLLMVYPSSLNPGSQEVTGSKLIDSLVKNNKYYFSFKLNLSGGTGVAYAVKKFGFKLSTKKMPLIFPNTSSNDYIVNNFATFTNNFYLTDSLNWMNIKGSFIADSNYKYFNIGGFYDYANIDTLKFLSQPGQSSYYYLDDVCISTDSNTCKINTQPSCIFTSLKANTINNKALSIYPNPTSNSIWITGLSSFDYSIYNLNGEMIKHGSSNNKTEIDLSFLKAGLYSIRITSDFALFTQKIIINPKK